MGSVMITDPAAPGGVIEAKLISGIDDHSRYSVIAKVVPRATVVEQRHHAADILDEAGAQAELEAPSAGLRATRPDSFAH